MLAVDGSDVCNDGTLDHYLTPDPVNHLLGSFASAKLWFALPNTQLVFAEQYKNNLIGLFPTKSFIYGPLCKILFSFLSLVGFLKDVSLVKM